jgi:hypothetical protein
MNIPELLNEALKNKDWSKVDEAHMLLTGISLLQQPADGDSDDQVETENSQDANSFVASSYKDGKPYEHASSSGAARRESIDTNNRENSWVDDGTIAADEKVSENPSLGVANPVKRTRPPATKNVPSQKGEMRVDQSPKLRER